MKTSIGLPSVNVLPLLPVVLFKFRAILSSISETALLESILLPKIKNGTLDNSSIANKASNSAFDSSNLWGSAASTKKTIPLTSGK
ncbi:hypothetical protein WICMUC_005918 [Wickerhamomyces mucosus]|uniref:Uncharacterized protein n=1 Tax=Wickerhamomyces mucosus TaxID=1378264 RepID=A0A9P8P2H3_9ASCO|nr:hypothetical protein WICMUC_005918 [Wickerhamomyces mucosus]